MAVFGLSATTPVLGDLTGIPTIPFTAGDGVYALGNVQTIVVDAQFASLVDTTKDTLIPPTLLEFAQTFADDLTSSYELNTSVVTGKSASDSSIFLTLGDSSLYLDVAGRESSEGYTLSVTPTGITITGASPLGAWWGTRTVLQQAALNNGSIFVGTGSDTPGWGTRGMMLDIGRHFYPKEFLVEMCAYMSFFKQNTFHLHLSDNLYNNVAIYSEERSLELYARFRLWSESESVAGLNKYRNESYSLDEFNEIQSSCAARGVTILPEIEAPGHALVIVQWKPELGYSTDLSLLNISHPDTIPTMKTIWAEFLPWFQTKTVSIGADEYTGPSTDYNTFVNAMAEFISSTGNKSMRIWGTFPPVYDGSITNNIYQNVSIQHWEYFEDNPYYDYIKNNYSVLNSNDDFYVVNKYSGSYLQAINLTKTFAGSPDHNFWRPNIFDQSNATNNPPASEPLVLGAIAPLWNDYGSNATTYLETYYAWRSGIPALADKQWGGNLTSSAFNAIFETLHAAIPGQNLDRTIPTTTITLETDCPTTTNGTIRISPSCTLTTGISSAGRNYTVVLAGLTISSLDAPANVTLITGSDSALMLTPTLTFLEGGNYFRLNSTLPLNQTVNLSIIGRGVHTYASVADAGTGETLVDEEEFLAVLGINGERFVWREIAFAAPAGVLGGEGAGWTGSLEGIELLPYA